jgi:hypothetical protein
VDLTDKTLLDVGCGRADLLDYLLARGVRPHDYTGIEAVEPLADAAQAKAPPRCTILRADFLKEPIRMFVGAEVVYFSGSLNTLDAEAFYAILPVAFDAAGTALVFNFLASPMLAGTDYLTWHRAQDVLAFARTLSPKVRHLTDYLPGDCTVAIDKP